jgi:hypothetical protein
MLAPNHKEYGPIESVQPVSNLKQTFISRCPNLLHGSSNGIESGGARFREASRARAPDSPVPGECMDARTARPDGEHEREEVVSHWEEAKSWLVAPVAVSADLLGGGGSGFELLVGFTRLGNLLGMLDREEVREVHKHLVWVGRQQRPT